MTKTEERLKKTGLIYRDAIIHRLSNIFQSRPNFIAANFNKVNSKDLSQLRIDLALAGARLQLTKTSLFKIFLKKENKDSIKDFFYNPTLEKITFKQLKTFFYQRTLIFYNNGRRRIRTCIRSWNTTCSTDIFNIVYSFNICNNQDIYA